MSCGEPEQGPEPEPDPPTPVTPVDPEPQKDTIPPTITVSMGSVNVITGPAVAISDNVLLIDEVSVASWKDDVSPSCTVALTLIPTAGEEKTINSGDTLSEEGTLIITVVDEFQNKTTAEIVLSAVAIYGLENLENLSMQVDEAINLLQGITIAEGLTLHGVEYEKDDEIALVSDPESFVLEYPCTICIILTVAKPDGTQIEIRVDGITVNPLEFNAPALETADVINEHYPWFNNLTEWYLELGYDPSVLYNKQKFVYPHVLVSYITGERYRWDNLEYIIVGEIPGIYECEDVGPNGDV